MADLIVIGIVLVIVSAAVCYIIKAKKSGIKCIGCPAASSCSGSTKGADGCGCGCDIDFDEYNRRADINKNK